MTRKPADPVHLADRAVKGHTAFKAANACEGRRGRHAVNPWRYASVSALGLLAGAAIVLLLPNHESLFEPTAPEESGTMAPGVADARVEDASHGGANGLGEVSVAQQALAYREAFSLSDPLELQARIERAALLPFSKARDLELSALLARFLELDSARAIEFAQSIHLEIRDLLPPFVAWAETDPRAVLIALDGLDDPAAVRAIGLALLDVFSDGAPVTQKLFSMLDTVNHPGLQIELLRRLAERDPHAALDSALEESDPALRRNAASQVAAAWARADPLAALHWIGRLTSVADRRTLYSAVVTEWAGFDALGALAHLASAPPQDAAGTGLAFLPIAASVPAELLGAADGLPGTLREHARTTALRALAERDAPSALAHVEAMPPGLARSQALRSIASSYGRSDPDAALAWLQSLPDASEDLFGAVVSGIAQVDFDRAVDLVFEAVNAPDLTVLSLTRRPDRLLEVADRLVAEGPQHSPSMRHVLSVWAGSDPSQALEWALANAEDLDAASIAQFAQGFAGRDIELAANAATQWPSALRSEWMSVVASRYGEFDPESAMRWVSELQYEPGHDERIALVVQGATRRNPRAAAELLNGAGAHGPRIAPYVAAEWSRREPAEAARWALGAIDEELRTRAVAGVASGWASRDPAAAERWVLDLPRGEMRDQALERLLLAEGAKELSPASPVIDAFSSSATRDRAIERAISALRYTNPARARGLAEALASEWR